MAQSLASSTPAPGGGAAAALNAAVGAALIEMACNLTIGRPRYAQHEAEMRAVLAEATELRNRAMRLAGDDARAYGAVSQAHTLPKETDAQRQARAEQLQRAFGSSCRREVPRVPLAHALASMRFMSDGLLPTLRQVKG